MDGLLLALGVVRVDLGRGRVARGLTTADCQYGQVKADQSHLKAWRQGMDRGTGSVFACAQPLPPCDAAGGGGGDGGGT